MPDVEDRLRAALQFNAARVEGAETDLREPHRSRLVPALAGVAAILAVIGIAVGFGARPGSHDSSAGSGTTSFAGNRWRLTSIQHAGKTSAVPADTPAGIAFTDTPNCTGTGQPRALNDCSGEFTFDNAKNIGSGAFSRTDSGFSIKKVNDSGFDGRSGPLSARSDVVEAVDAVTRTGAVTAVVDEGTTLTLSRAGYVLSFARTGSGPVRTDAPSTTALPPPAFVGSDWRLDVVLHGKRKLAVSSKSATGISFGLPDPACRPSVRGACPGELSFNDGIADSSGTYRLTAHGFTIGDDLATQAIGYAGHDPAFIAIQAAMQSLHGTVRAAVDYGHLNINTAGYVLTFARRGAATAPSAGGDASSASSSAAAPSPDRTSSGPSATGPSSATPAAPASSSGVHSSAVPGYVGHTWLLQTIQYQGKSTQVSAEKATATFTENSLSLTGLAAQDCTLVPTAGGFTTKNFSKWAVGWASGVAPEVMARGELVLAAFNALGDGFTQARATTSSLTLTAGGHTMTFHR